MINKLRRNIADVVTAKKQLEMQSAKLSANVRTLEEQANRALDSSRRKPGKTNFGEKKCPIDADSKFG